MSNFLGIDLGASSLKATLINEEGHVLAESTASVDTVRPQPGWAEQDPADWEAAMGNVLADIFSKNKVSSLNGISFTGGTHTSVLLDHAREVVRRPILWSDQRAVEEAVTLNSKMQDRLLAIAYNRAAPTWSISHFAWLQKHEPETVRRTSKVMFAKDWLRSCLTDDHLTDTIDAQGSLLIDGVKQDWSEELCGAINWDISTLPKVRRATDLAGKVSPKAAHKFGLSPGIPVFIGTADTAAETWGAGAIEAGDAVIKLATAGVVSVVVDRPYLEPDIAYKSYLIPDHGYVLGATNSCASAHRWLCELLSGSRATNSAYNSLDLEASKVDTGAGGLMFHPYLQGERAPYWDAKLRGDFIGLSMFHGPGHMMRALYEGIALSLRDASLPFQNAGLNITQASLIGGGSKSAVWAQIIADVFNIPVRKPKFGDASYAAALIAAVGAGVFVDGRDAIRKAVKFEDPILPDKDRAATYEGMLKRYRQAKVALTCINHEICDQFQN